MQNFRYTKITAFLNAFSLLRNKQVSNKQIKKYKSKNKIDPIYNDWKKIGSDMRKGIIQYDSSIKWR